MLPSLAAEWLWVRDGGCGDFEETVYEVEAVRRLRGSLFLVLGSWFFWFLVPIFLAC